MYSSPSPRPNSRSILLIDDDVELCSLLAEFFSENGFRVDTANDGGSGLAKAIRAKYDLILLDMMLPVLDGMHVLQHLRRRSSVAVILLTARTATHDRIGGLESGADYYVTKPFDPDELLAAVRAVIRRSSQNVASETPPVRIGEFRLNPRMRELWRGKTRIDLTSVEFDILDLLMRSAGRVVSRDELSTVLHHRRSTPFEHSLEVHISHLRKKLETGKTLIRTIRGVGYIFVAAEDN